MQKNNILNEVQTLSKTQCYQAALYARLSREDGDKSESDSIVNQRELIKEFLKAKPEIKLTSERVDDGYSGVTFDRPALNAMLEDVKAGKINCIVVKDLSRFGRNYIEVGRYIRTLFPLLEVRFIAINDGYDSAEEHNLANDYIIPFKNIINDAYCADISKKIRSQFEIKRKKGDYIGPFTPFGYLKSLENKNKLVVDDIAAEVVKNIFKNKITGMSCQSIADKLNSLGVLSPLEYKKSIGQNLKTKFKINLKAKWSAVAVKRILTDEIYIGVLLQGKTTTPNYKIKQKIIKDKSDWERIENSHEAVISHEEFTLVSDLMNRDTYKTEVYLFSGMLFCSKCGYNLIRKVSTVNSVKYTSHACIKNHKNNNKRAGCSGVRIKEDTLFQSIIAVVKSHINGILELEEIMRSVEKMPQNERGINKLHEHISAQQAEIDKLEKRKIRLYEDYSDRELTYDEYVSFKKNYDTQISATRAAIKNLEYEINKLDGKKNQSNNDRIESFKNLRDFKQLTREIIVKLIDKIVVYEGGRLEIIFRYKNEFEEILDFTKALPDSADNTNSLDILEVRE